MSVYKAINAVQNDLSVIGIAKDKKNIQQGYKFRGIDDVYNALAPLLAKHGLCILPRAVSRECVERRSTKDTALFYVTVCVEFDFVAAEDGTKHTITMYGEAMDSGDKATNKAMSAAFKYACMQAFSIPTEGDNDADQTTHEVKHAPVAATMAHEGITVDPKIGKVADAIRGHLQEDRDLGVFEEVEGLTQNEKIALWSLLTPAERKRIKEVETQLRRTAPE